MEEKTPETPEKQPVEALESPLEQQLSAKQDIIEGLQFYASPIRFNSTLFQGFKLILEKLTEVEAKLAKIEEKFNDKR